MLPDTIDYERTRLFINVPENSLKLSGQINGEEGFWVYYLFPFKCDIPGILTIDYTVMNRNRLLYTDKYDEELWNTLNRNNVGSRCFKRNNKFFRIDKFEDGLEIYYENINEEFLEEANAVINSVLKKPLKPTDPPLNPHKRKTTRI